MSHGNLVTYQRLPLDPAKKVCRILRLFPGTESEQLCGELDVQDLENTKRQPYICVSYVWGDISVTGPIKINNEELQVTTNLLSCLYHLRNPEDVTILWIDAICINQEDLSEKSHQVAMMSDIYSGCSTVYLWLGSPPGTRRLPKDPFTLLRHFAENGHYHELPGFSKDDKGAWVFQENEDFLVLWKSFLLVAGSKWWTRSWTIQETALPRTAIALYGHWRMSFDAINLARENRNRHLGDSRQCGCPESLRAFPIPRRKVFDRFGWEVEFIERLRLLHLKKHNPGYSYDLEWTGPLPDPPFHEVVQTFSFRYCQDPRDRVFSLLAMAKSTAFETFRPDYRVPAYDCYTEVFGRMLSETDHDYRCLIGAAFGSSLHGLPSWVRDFSQIFSLDTVGEELRRIQIYSLFKASWGRTSDLRIQNKKELHVTGVQADRIKEVGIPVKDLYSVEKLEGIFAQWTNLCEVVIGSTDEILVSKTMSRVICPTATEDWRTWVEFGRGWRRSSEADMPTGAEWQQFMNGDAAALPGHLESGAAMAITGRSFYITQNGKIGLCDAKARAGDEVWVLFGSNVPFVLRKTMQEHQPGSTRRFVGDCFLDGVMDGEVFEGVTEDTPLILI